MKIEARRNDNPGSRETKQTKEASDMTKEMRPSNPITEKQVAFIKKLV